MSLRRAASGKTSKTQRAIRQALRSAAKEVSASQVRPLARRLKKCWILAPALATLAMCWAYTAKRGEP